MTYLYHNPAYFADEAAAGFAEANARWVRRVHGGVVRTEASVPGQVAVVIGGGSGHYPAFAGFVGNGLAAGAAMGNLFSSPSAQSVVSVATAAQSGGGVLLSYGNYAGDVLNFDQAQAQLIEAGIPCRTVVVTDDIASAPAGQTSKRRGIAGGLFVYKTAGAAAAAGASLDEVWQVADRANGRVRSFGVAFSGCTLPGAPDPLFTVPHGVMSVGMGVHGEPGIDQTVVPSADELARLLVSSLLREAPIGEPLDGARVALILNGLGSIKCEELFVLYGRVSALLRAEGITVVDPEVGEFVTSFEMAGVSLTLGWLDDELHRLWAAPASTPAYRKGWTDGPVPESGISPESRLDEPGADARIAVGEASEESRRAARWVVAAFRAAEAAIDDAAEELGRLDAIAGDGDHGIGMRRGVSAAAASAEQAVALGAGAGTVLRLAGAAWADHGGGTSGALWGIGLRAIGEELADASAPCAAAVVAALRRAQSELHQAGRASPGDKTMLDALAPFSAVLGSRIEAGDGLATAVRAAADAAVKAAEATKDLVPKIGRARPHAQRSLGNADPGAVSLALILRAVQHILEEELRP